MFIRCSFDVLKERNLVTESTGEGRVSEIGTAAAARLVGRDELAAVAISRDRVRSGQGTEGVDVEARRKLEIGCG